MNTSVNSNYDSSSYSSSYSSSASYASSFDRFSSNSEVFEFIKYALIFVAWTGGSWLLQGFFDQLLSSFTQYSLAWWFTCFVWILCVPGMIVSAIVLLVIYLVVLVLIWVFEGIVWLIQYFISNPY